MLSQTILDCVSGWLAANLTPDAFEWFRLQLLQIAREDDERHLGKALGWAPRKLGKAEMQLCAADLAQAVLLRPGFDPSGWRVDQTARVAFILAAFRGDERQFANLLDRLADTAEINELIALYAGFALYPAQCMIEPRAREATRSAMRPVFEAMAHRNPYPVAHFDDPAWNQMIVKTFFLDSPLWPVQGIEQRANPELARILVDLAHERWAAGRPVSLELWRCVGRHADSKGVAALQRVLEVGSENEKLAVALSLLHPCVDADTGALGRVRSLCEAQGLFVRAASWTWRRLAES